MSDERELGTPEGPYRLRATCGADSATLVPFVKSDHDEFVLAFSEQGFVVRVDTFRPSK